jgi:hypothetical protein
MFSIECEDPRFIRIHATGRLGAGDYDKLEPALAAELKRRGGRSPLLLDLRGWRGWTGGGLIRDLRFDLSHRKSFSRIAVLGDRRWHEWVTIVGKPLFAAPMRYFGAGEERGAAEWVSG